MVTVAALNDTATDVEPTTSMYSNVSGNVSLNRSDYDYYYYYDYDDDDDAVFSAPSAAVAMAIIRYVLPIIVTLGTAGNALSAAVLVHRRLSGASIDVYRVALAVADTTVLYVPYLAS